MKNWVVVPRQQIRGNLRVASDKSISHRAVMLAALAKGETEITGFLESEDCLATLKAFAAMGISYRKEQDKLLITGNGLHGLTPPQDELDFGNSGTGMRLMAGVLAGQKFASTLVGDVSLMRRPMRRVSEPLSQMGAKILTTEQGTAPLRISPSSLQAIDYSLPVASAQLKSALMFAGLYAEGTTVIRETLGISRDHSERMFRTYGLGIEEEASSTGKIIRIQGSVEPKACAIAVPADISSAAFFIVAGLLAQEGEILLQEVGINPTRAAVIDILKMMGADIRLQNERLSGAEPIADIAVYPSQLHGIDIPKELVPIAIDEFPILFIAASCAEGITRASNLGELRVKESDRLGLMERDLHLLGVDCQAGLDSMEIKGKSQGAAFGQGEIQSDGDHRIAMSFAIASLRAAGEIKILDTANVATSFPNFSQLARQVGLALDEFGE